ncbi:acyl-CoA dehydrogenase family protein, partial [Chloroflexota bacterium]
PGWPKEYGGLGFTSIEQGIVQEEESYSGVLWPNLVGYHLAGPATILFGTEEQKKEFIPPITRGDTIWMQAFTEPEAGSDEANMQCRAVEDGDDYVLNGQKTFISGKYKPDYLFTEARTLDVTPKHRGLSLFLIPADTPGITYHPLPTMGAGLQNEIFFDDVRVPKKYLLGELNRGFYHAMAAFEFERAGCGGATRAKRSLEDFVQFCKEEKRNGKPLIEDPEIRKTLAQLAVEVEVWRLTAWYAQWWFGQREKLGPKPYDLTGFFTKIFSTRHAEAMMRTLGLYGQLKAGSKWAKLAGRIDHSWQTARSLHGGGTFEIYKVVIAQRGLGLSRPPRPAAAKSEENQ